VVGKGSLWRETGKGGGEAVIRDITKVRKERSLQAGGKKRGEAELGKLIRRIRNLNSQKVNSEKVK
jgi:hypothetical protein